MARPTRYQERATKEQNSLIWEMFAKASLGDIAGWLGCTKQNISNRKSRGLNLTYQEAIIIRMHLDELEKGESK